MATAYRRSYSDKRGRKRLCKSYTLECKIGDTIERLPTGFRDGSAADELGRKVERLANLRAAGEQPDAVFTRWLEGLPTKLRDRLAGLGLLTGRAAAATRKLAEHLAEYRQALLDGVASPKQKGPATPKYADLVKYRVETLLAGIGATYLSDVTPEAVGRYLAEQRAKSMSVQTSNNYVKDAKAFFNWLVRAKRATENPIRDVAKLQVTTKARKHVRRALEHAEGLALLRAARSGSDAHGMTGEERYWLYRLALETALRSGELSTLTPVSFHLNDDEPCVTVFDDDTKNRQAAELPLRADTAAGLRVFLTDKPPGVRVFPMPKDDAVVRMLRHDLKRAGIAYADDAGRVCDFHALRVTCLTWLAAAGVPIKTLQTFARHSTPVLTLNVYSRTLHGSLADAATRLPDLTPRPAQEAAKRNGT